MTETHTLRCSECGAVMGEVDAPTDERYFYMDGDGCVGVGGHYAAGSITIRCEECSK